MSKAGASVRGLRRCATGPQARRPRRQKKLAAFAWMIEMRVERTAERDFFERENYRHIKQQGTNTFREAGPEASMRYADEEHVTSPMPGRPPVKRQNQRSRRVTRWRFSRAQAAAKAPATAARTSRTQWHFLARAGSRPNSSPAGSQKHQEGPTPRAVGERQTIPQPQPTERLPPDSELECRGEPDARQEIGPSH